MLRPGNASAAMGAIGVLRRLIRMIRGCFPAVRIRVRLDCGFANPTVLEFLDAQTKLEYAVAMAKNAVLQVMPDSRIAADRSLSEADQSWLRVLSTLIERQARMFVAQWALELGRSGIS